MDRRTALQSVAALFGSYGCSKLPIASTADWNNGATANDGRHLIVAAEESDSTVAFYDSDTGQELGRIAVGYWPHEIAISPDGRTAYVSNFGLKDYDENIGRPGNSISTIDIPSRCEVGRLYTSGVEGYKAPHGLAFSADAQSLYVNVEKGAGKVLVFDLSTYSTAPTTCQYTQVDVPKRTHNILTSPDYKHLWTVSGVDGVSRIDLSTKAVTGQFSCAGPIRGLVYSADEKVLIASASNEICIVDPASCTILRRFTDLGVGQILYSVPTPDGRYILSPAVWQSQIVVLDAHSGTVSKRILTGIDPIHIVVAPHRKSFYVSHGRSLFISEVSLRDFELVKRIPTKGGPNGIATTTFSTPSEKGVLKFGACLPLSGDNYIEGRDIRLGYQFWQELVNAAGGIFVGSAQESVRRPGFMGLG